VYQDVVLAGKTAFVGARDCPGRWEAIAPHLPPLGTALDVGSNFGWFALKLAEYAPDCVVASVEADLRSAAVQRRVLASHELRRVVLLTHPAGTHLAQRFAAAQTRFDAVLCLAVLHWMRDHRRFLTTLAPQAGRIFVEQPDPREEGAGVERLRREIGPIGRYLREVFPGRAVRQIAELPNHRESPYPRELWMVEEPAGWTSASPVESQPAAGLDVAALADLAPTWPPRSWWEENGEWGMGNGECGELMFTADGLTWVAGDTATVSLASLRRRLERLPEATLLTRGQAWHRGARRFAGTVARRLGLRR
jgi:SAM-dependent methyltransferase